MNRITLKNVNKEFKLGHKKDWSALARFVSLFSHSYGGAAPILSKAQSKQVDTIKVASGISFEARSAEVVGIVGRNGSGKSTLLRLIAGIYEPDSGEIKTEGKLVYLNGYGQGLEQKLTMKENIYLMGALMGLSSAEIRERFKDIVEFSGLREFINVKVFQFSSGMQVRLSFSVTIFCVKHHNPEILLLDEVLSGAGDIDFQNKALLKMEEFIRGGATVLLVSHASDMIEKYCNRAVWIDSGKIIKNGKPAEVIAAYLGQV